MKEFQDPLSKKKVKREKKLPVSQTFSETEKFLFNQTERILKIREKEAILAANKFEQNRKEKEKAIGTVPLNNTVRNNRLNKLAAHSFDCPELETNAAFRILTLYVKKDQTVDKNDIKVLFDDLVGYFRQEKIEIDTDLLFKNMLKLYAAVNERATLKEIKRTFYETLNFVKVRTLIENEGVNEADVVKIEENVKPKEDKKKEVKKDAKKKPVEVEEEEESVEEIIDLATINERLEYLKKIGFEEGKKPEKKVKESNRQDVFAIKSFSGLSAVKEVVLNDNLLKKQLHEGS